MKPAAHLSKRNQLSMDIIILEPSLLQHHPLRHATQNHCNFNTVFRQYKRRSSGERCHLQRLLEALLLDAGNLHCSNAEGCVLGADAGCIWKVQVAAVGAELPVPIDVSLVIKAFRCLVGRDA
ncbi:hypothetical protein Nepgr_001052 [Nepenthes gracilis]|uniref:Uncharacterized protein n=1 Tax=Nepenthes gracilis TaxID=150966 RepID=A0AAD3P6D6_NEPGR|nr:hypothetical protein Nepgr_001052 [Nepenthes gracilis]